MESLKNYTDFFANFAKFDQIETFIVTPRKSIAYRKHFDFSTFCGQFSRCSIACFFMELVIFTIDNHAIFCCYRRAPRRNEPC